MTEGATQTMGRFLEIHNFSFNFTPYDDMLQILQAYVDGNDMTSLNLAGTYETMIDRLMCRLATVQLVSFQ